MSAVGMCWWEVLPKQRSVVPSVEGHGPSIVPLWAVVAFVTTWGIVLHEHAAPMTEKTWNELFGEMAVVVWLERVY